MAAPKRTAALTREIPPSADLHPELSADVSLLPCVVSDDATVLAAVLSSAVDSADAVVSAVVSATV